MTSTRPRRQARVTAALVPTVLLLTSACSKEPAPDAESPADVLAAAKAELDGTSGVALSLTTDELPDGVDGVVDATGIGTHAPGFEGDITLLVSSLSVDVPVVAVDGKVYATVPFATGYTRIDPADYGAPDPADLMATEGGISSWLTAVEGVQRGSETRVGEQVLTTYSGTLPGDSVVSVIPSADASAEFAATFKIDDEGLLDTAEVSGPFYGDKGDVEYTVTLSDYGIEKDIAKP